MLNSKIDTITLLKNQGKTKKALELTESVLNDEELTPEERVSCLILKANLNYDLWQLNGALKIADQAYQESSKLEMKIHSFDALVIVATVCYWLRKNKKLTRTIRRMETLFKSNMDTSSAELTKKEALLARLRAFLNSSMGKMEEAFEFHKQSLKLYKKLGNERNIAESLFWISFFLNNQAKTDEALEYCTQSLELRKKLNIKIDTAQNLVLMITIFTHIGDIEKALNYGKQALEIEEILTFHKIWLFNGLGAIYNIKGDFDRSLEYINRALAISEKLDQDLITIECLRLKSQVLRAQGNPHLALESLEKAVKLTEEGGFNISRVLPQLIRTLVIIGNIERAWILLKQYKQKAHNLALDQISRELEAEILQKTGSASDKEEAERILRQLLEEGCIVGLLIPGIIIQLCSLLIDKLRQVKSVKLLNEINSLIDQLAKTSEENRSHRFLGYSYLLKAQVAAIEVNVDDARRFFSHAQQITDMHGLDVLTRSISAEHDRFLNELKEWQNIEKSKPPISEKFDLTSLEATIDLILEKRLDKPPELTHEEPILLLIVAEGGVPAFSNFFSQDLKHEDDMISNFLSAFNYFSEELFSKRLDRAKFGDYLLVMDSIGPFSVCYLFKGQSYLAKQKIIQFAHRVQNTASIWKVFEDFQTTHQSIVLTENPPLESLITEIFIKKDALKSQSQY